MCDDFYILMLFVSLVFNTLFLIVIVALSFLLDSVTKNRQDG